MSVIPPYLHNNPIMCNLLPIYIKLVIAIANVPPFRERKKNIKKLEGNANSQFHKKWTTIISAHMSLYSWCPLIRTSTV